MNRETIKLFLISLLIGRMAALNYKIESKFEEVPIACTKLKSFCEENSLSDFSAELQLVLTEALNNIIEHAYSKIPGNTIEIQLFYDSQRFTIQLDDFGIQNTKEIKTELNFDPNDIDSIPERGMGLFIINNIMSKVEYRRTDNKNTFILIKDLT